MSNLSNTRWAWTKLLFLNTRWVCGDTESFMIGTCELYGWQKTTDTGASKAICGELPKNRVQRAKSQREVPLDGEVLKNSSTRAQKSRQRGDTSIHREGNRLFSSSGHRLVWRYLQSGKIKPTEYRRHCFRRSIMRLKWLCWRWPMNYMVGKWPGRQEDTGTGLPSVWWRPVPESIGNIGSQIYNLRRSRHYRGKRFTHTRPVAARIGERRGRNHRDSRVTFASDTVHQETRRPKRSLSFNAVEKSTNGKSWPQCRESPSMIGPLLESMLNQFPFQS